MKAFVMKEIGRVAFLEKPIPRPGPNDAIVRTTRALICTSDSHTVGGGIGPREDLTLGHEAVGVVHEVGAEVKVFKQGDRVVVGAITPDWGSPAAQDGYSSQSGGPLGGWKFSNSKDGVFADYFHVNDAEPWITPTRIDPEATVCPNATAPLAARMAPGTGRGPGRRPRRPLGRAWRMAVGDRP